MKIIISRKGFDSSSGGVPSPILPDGRVISLPIPDSRQSTRFKDLNHPDIDLATLVTQLTKGKITADQGVHLDPDINREYLPRSAGWRPVFGQYGAAQAHLANQAVGPGDLFVFFGLFNFAQQTPQGWSWLKQSKPSHRFWGYFQIQSIVPLELGTAAIPPWLQYHAHCQFQARHNTLYIAAPRLQLNGRDTGLPGAGTFPQAQDALVLTAPSAQRVSLWRLPQWFYPSRNKPALSFHSDKTRWRRRGQFCELNAVARGQEFVFDTQYYPDAVSWIEQLITDAT